MNDTFKRIDASHELDDTTRTDHGIANDTATHANWLSPGACLAEISEDLLKVLEPHFEEIEFEHGAHLIRQGEQVDQLFVLLSGHVEVYSDVGTQRHLIDESGPGDVMGEMALVTNEARTASVIAKDRVKALSLSAKKVRELTAEHPELSCLMNNVVAKRLGSVEYDALAGKSLNGFLLKRRLGKGGMGIVYEAIDSELDRTVALKMMSHRLVHDCDASAQFEREFEIVRLLESENIVKTFSRFAAFGTWFLVMEYCAGKPLNRLVKNGPVSEEYARHVFCSISSALNHSIKHGIVHRDIKPSNMIEHEDGSVKLTDFGLATPLRSLDKSTRLCGTAAYLAPELLAGSAPSVETDYFAFGMSMLELLTGKCPVEPGSTSHVLGQIRRWRKPDVRLARPDVSPDFCDQIAALLDPEPSSRVLRA